MTQRDELNRLADACEKASGADRELEGHIRCTVFARKGAFVRQSPINGAWCIYEIGSGGRERPWAPFGLSPLQRLGEFTASLDAAMTLVPEKHTVQLSDWDHQFLRDKGPWQAIVLPIGARGSMTDFTFSNRCDHAATPALALTAAALRATAATLNAEDEA